MKENQDYFIRMVNFPNWASAICVTPNDDGTYSVYANARYTIEQIRDKLPHELIHMIENHFNDERDVMTIEREADQGKTNRGTATDEKHNRQGRC